MPFVQRVIEPKHLSRTSLWDEDGKPRVSDDELEAVTNNTLSNALRQLASLVLVADDIFTELRKELCAIAKRSEQLQTRIGVVEEKVAAYDPKKVSVPESDICTFALLKDHYATRQEFTTGLFGSDSRPRALQALYDAAAKTPVHLMRQMDRWRRDGHRSSRFFLCTPVLGERRRKLRNKVDIDIETRMPAAVEELRRWTSTEALGEITVAPDCTTRIVSTDGELSDGTMASDDEGLDHKLPSPEEQLHVVALKFPPEIVAVDVSGRCFDRMSIQRRSLLHPGEYRTGGSTTATAADGSMRRRTRTRRPRSKRRNTLAGTDQKEIRDALTAGADSSSALTQPETTTTTASEIVCRSRSSDILRSSKRDSPETKKSHFNSLKQWGKNRLKQFNRSSSSSKEPSTNDIDDVNTYETVTIKRSRSAARKSNHERNPSLSSSEKSSISLPMATPLNVAVKLRESAAQRRQRRAGKDEPHSSSGNWSASSESGRASIGSEITAHPKSTTSTCTSNNSLNQQHPPGSVNSRRKFNINNSTSGSVTSEGTLTPDIIHDLHEDGETSSVYSCDTEGYYTSFHMDSGLKTLKEEDLPSSPLQSANALSNCTAENEYELFGKGSTSTTTSSAGTVCTTLRASESNRSLIIGPAVPERKSSLSKNTNKDSNSPPSSLERDLSSEKTGTVKRSPATGNKATVVAVIHKQVNGDVSPDSGHNTSSSPIESINSPNGMRSGSEFEFSESSDMEGPERIERIREKTAINSSRIPSMCAITPPVSDDESIKSHKLEYTLGNMNMANRPKLELPLEQEKRPRVSGDKVKVVNLNSQTGYVTVETVENQSTNRNVRAASPSGGSVIVNDNPVAKPPPQPQPIIKATLLPLNNMFGRLRSNLSNLNLRREKVSPVKQEELSQDDPLFDSGEYVTIADVRNNNEKFAKPPEVNYVNETCSEKLDTVLHGKIREAEYISLDELPRSEEVDSAQPSETTATSDSLERRRKGARVTLDAEGKVIYSSDSLKRRKGAHTTFEPGPFVKTLNTETMSPLPVHRTPKALRPALPSQEEAKPQSPHLLGKLVIRAAASGATTSPTSEFVRLPPSTIVTPNTTSKLPASRGAYVHVQDTFSTPTHDKERVPSPSNPSAMKSLAQTGIPLQSRVAYHHDVAFSDAYYSTIPGKYEQYEAERSTTPDITRGLTRRFDSMGRSEHRNLGIPVQVPQIHQITHQVPERGSSLRTTSPLSSKNTQQSKHGEESFRISPIDPRNLGGFQSSTPQSKTDLKAAVNLENKLLSPKKSTMSNEELYAVIHKSKKKLNIKAEDSPSAIVEAPKERIESPKHQVKSPETGYIGRKSRTRFSWSPSKGEYIDFNADIDELSSSKDDLGIIKPSETCGDRKRGQQTSRLDFKKLLLQHGTKSGVIQSNTKKLSAVEQLKISKQNIQPKKTEVSILEYSGSPRSLHNRKLGGAAQPKTPEKPKPAPKLLSPRAQWRFASPRSDVLSSTILEDCREDESPNSSTERKPKVAGVVSQRKETSPAESVTRRLQAQRAQFFSGAPPGGGAQNDGGAQPPTLETAF